MGDLTKLGWPGKNNTVGRDGYNIIHRQLGEAGLGPEMFCVVEEKADKNWGLMIMEELPDGGFEEDFTSSNVTHDDMRAMGYLFGKIHLLPTNEFSKASDLAKKVVLEEGIVDKEVVEELYQTRGGYIIFLILWWKKYFPAWMAKNSPQNHPLPAAYVERFLNIILKVGRIKPLTQVFGRLGFSHTDAWYGNLMRKGEKIVAIDCETASIGPAFLDLGGIVSTASLPHIDRDLREALILSFYEAIEEECFDMEAALYDLELASIHRHLWGVLCVQFGLVSAPLTDVERIGGLFFEKGEAMVNGMEQAVRDKELMKKIVDHGIFGSIKDKLSEGREEAIRKHVSIISLICDISLKIIFFSSKENE